MMQAHITDKSTKEYQRIAWEALKKSINGLINKANIGNLNEIVTELLQENIVRGRYVYAGSFFFCPCRCLCILKSYNKYTL